MNGTYPREFLFKPTLLPILSAVPRGHSSIPALCELAHGNDAVTLTGYKNESSNFAL